MFKRMKFLIYTRLFIVFAYYVIRLYSMTFRLKIINEPGWKKQIGKDRPILLCAWHQQFFSAIRHFKTYAGLNPALMISQSRDGDLIAGVARKSGWKTARGSSSKDGRKAMDAMIDHLTTHGLGAHILDGPTGPMGKIKSGIIKMAQDSNALVVPFYTHAENAWFFKSWDRFMLPKPFSRVTITFGDTLCFNSKTRKKTFEEQRLYLENLMLPGLMHSPA